MTTGPIHGVLRHLRRSVLRPTEAAGTDGQLLERFVAQRDAAAFEALVRRHGPMVWGVCCRLLRHPPDAEDAFQATFLVLVRKAAAVCPRELVGNWLYGVASRTALAARAARSRRAARERQVDVMPEPLAAGVTAWEELWPLLDRELARLPDKYRVAVVLCDLEGRSRKDVARQLRLPEGTLSSRLATARRLLARRLARHGLTLSGGAVAALLGQHVSAAAVPPLLMVATLEVALHLANHPAARGIASAPVVALTEGVLRQMFRTKLHTVLAGLALLVVTAGGAAGLPALRAQPGAPPPGVQPGAPPPGVQPGALPPRAAAAEPLLSAWHDLASDDEARAARAVLALSTSPKEAVALLRGKLRPVKVDPREVAAWIKQLDSESFQVRQEAQQNLEYCGKYIRDDLKKALAANPTLEARGRLQKLLDVIALPEQQAALAPDPGRAVGSVSVSNINGAIVMEVDGVKVDLNPRVIAANSGRPRQWVRASRAVAVLEHLGTAEAVALLQALSRGEAEALPTVEARAALERLNKGVK